MFAAASKQEAQPRVFRLWPEHVAALGLWRSVQTQLRWDDGRPTGLDYGGVRASPAFRRLPRSEREQVFEDVCCIEQAWLPARARIVRQRTQGVSPWTPPAA